MRKLLVAGFVAASSLMMTAAAGHGPVTLPPLAPGEVLLEVNAVGIVATPATSATLTASARVTGAS